MKRKIITGVLSIWLTFLFFAGCGVDNFIYLYPVTQLLNSPSSDPAYNFYKFRTSNRNNTDNSSGYFKGFEIYYRIYNSTAIASQDASDINTYNTNNPTTVFNYVAASKKYTRMTAFLRDGQFPLIPGESTDTDVLIRLLDYGTTDPANLLVGSASYGIPLRTKNEGTATDSFVFSEITNTDSDVQYLSTGEIDKWYVQAYVFAYGYDAVYKSIYSSAFALGTITVTN